MLMLRSSRARGVHGLMLMLLALCTALTSPPVLAADASAPIPITDFFRRPTATSAIVSPSGRYLALTQPGPNKRLRLVVLDLQDLKQSKPVAGFDDADIVDVAWVNDERLVFSATDRLLPGVQRYAGNGLFTVARDGGLLPKRLIKGKYEWLTAVRTTVDRELSPAHELYALLHDGSDDVVVRRFEWDSQGVPTGSTLLRLNTANGITHAIVSGAPEAAQNWALDAQGMPRAAVAFSKGRESFYLRPTADGPWQLMREFDTYHNEGKTLQPLRVAADGWLYAIGRSPQDSDTESLLRLDLAHPKAPPQVLMSLAGYDFSGHLILGAKGQLLGIRYLTDARATYWLDPRLKRIQADIDHALPGSVNMLDCGQCADPQSVLVTSWSDRQPAVYRLYNLKQGTLATVIESRPWIHASAMAKTVMKHFAARDGLSIPIYVTQPPGVKGRAPTIVLVHGGPWSRGRTWGWQNESQFLASRGYVVLEPQFRGSTGFGSTLYSAGIKQWGLAMQDDLADAARWAIKQGLADPKRVAIAGASYGGYATLMGLARDADLYRCGFEWVGVSDINLMYSITWSDFNDNWKRYGMPVLIGDPVKDAKQLAETSPIEQAARITRPLLMAYGGVDRRVPIAHGTRFRDAVSEHNANVEWIEYPLEGHGWSDETTDLDFWGRVETFLDKNLKNAP